MNKKSKRVAIVLEGSLGDSLMALPTLRLLEQHFGGENLFLISLDPSPQLTAATLFETRLPYRKFINIRTRPKMNRFARLIPWLLVAAKLRLNHVDICFYGVRQEDLDAFRHRSSTHKILLRLGASQILGTEPIVKQAHLKPVGLAKPSIGVLLYERILKSLDNDKVVRNFNCSFPSSKRDVEEAQNWLRDQGLDSQIPLLAVCITGKSSVQRWSYERYREVLFKIASEYPRLAFIFFGVKRFSKEVSEVRPSFDKSHFPENLTVGAAAEIMKRCVGYLGNDTGPMHLAASAGLRCVSIFSAHNPRGEWYPMGRDHISIESDVPCRDCRLTECKVHELKCLDNITANQVFESFQRAFGSRCN